MPKRFADTKLFDQSWFLDLPFQSKMIWLFLERSCDHAGIWEIDIPQMRRRLGCNTLNLIQFLDEVNRDYCKVTGDPIITNRVMPICNNTKLWMTGFISEQYEKGLNGINISVPAIKSVVKRLKDEGILEFALKEGFVRIQGQKPDSDELPLGIEPIVPSPAEGSSSSIALIVESEHTPSSPENDSSATIFSSFDKANAPKSLENDSSATISSLDNNSAALPSLENNDNSSIISSTGGKADLSKEACSFDDSHPLNNPAAKGSEPLERDKDKDKDKDMRSSSSSNVFKGKGGAGGKTKNPPPNIPTNEQKSPEILPGKQEPLACEPETENLHSEKQPPAQLPNEQEFGIITEISPQDGTVGIEELFKSHWGKRVHTPHEELMTAQLILDYGLDEVKTAFSEAVNHNRLTLAYIKGVLQNRRKKQELQKAQEEKKAVLQRQTEQAAEERRRGIKLNLIESVYGTS